MSGIAEAEVMRAKGYSEKDVLQADVQKAYAEGIGNMGPAISGGGGSSIVGDMMGLGVGMAAASAIAPQMGEMMQGLNNKTDNNRSNAATWNCSCGNTGIVGNFCNMCGMKNPIHANTWNCSCGAKGITGNFCSNCGNKKPENELLWDCKCGNKGITGKFCNMCGAKYEE